MSLVLGIDGGGTHTRASIVDGDKVLGHGEGGSIKRLRVGAEAAEANLRAVLKDVYAQAGVKGVRAACCGVASATMPGITEWITAVFNDFGVERLRGRRRPGDRARRRLPWRAGHPADRRNRLQHHWPRADGSQESAGGWSSRLGDEGSGYWIGLHSVRRALRAYDHEQPTQILKKVGEIWGTPDLDDLVNVGDGTPGPDFAALAPAINVLAEAATRSRSASSGRPPPTWLNSSCWFATSSAASTIVERSPGSLDRRRD
jgi:glucosamine kinase